MAFFTLGIITTAGHRSPRWGSSRSETAVGLHQVPLISAPARRAARSQSEAGHFGIATTACDHAISKSLDVARAPTATGWRSTWMSPTSGGRSRSVAHSRSLLPERLS